MPKKKYGWEIGQAPPTIEPHSLAKHRILREYVQRYIQVLTAIPGTEVLRLTLVDGFAGGGEYTDARSDILAPGSPLILLDAVRAAEVVVNATRTKPVRVDARFVFVDEDPKVLAYLAEVLRKRADVPKDDGVVRLLQGTFEAQLDPIIQQVVARGKAHRVIFVLDQYGYTDVPISLLRRIFDALPNAEVFLTLAVGWIVAYLPNAEAAADKLGISREALTRIRQAGEDALNLEDPSRRPDLLTVQRILHHVFTTDAGSRFYTPFFIVSRRSNRPYWLLHMANNQRANDVVKVLHWEIENHFQHFGGPGLVMLGYDPHADPEVTGQLPFAFDDEAERRTLVSLGTELPERIVARYPQGIDFGTLFRDLCNETPATREHLAKAVSELCVAGELDKIGGEGERPAPTTLPHNEDVITRGRQVVFTFGKSST